MRTAIISDVHGNYPALASVIEDAGANSVDNFIFLGDYIFDMPFSNEVARLLMNLDNAHIVKGNKEGYLRNLAKDNQDNWTLNQFGGLYQTFRELPHEIYDFLDNLAEECYIPVKPGVSVYAAHFPINVKILSPKFFLLRSSYFHEKMLEEPFTHEQYLTEFSDLINCDELRPQIEQINADIILFGHNHLQSYGYCGDKLIINPGSCGLPLDFNPAAAYTILEITDNGFTVTEKRVAYDIETAINQAKKTAVYEKSKIWSEIVFLTLRTGRDYTRVFFDIAKKIAVSKDEPEANFSNSTVEEAYEIFIKERETPNYKIKNKISEDRVN